MTATSAPAARRNTSASFFPTTTAPPGCRREPFIFRSMTSPVRIRSNMRCACRSSRKRKSALSRTCRWSGRSCRGTSRPRGQMRHRSGEMSSKAESKFRASFIDIPLPILLDEAKIKLPADLAAIIAPDASIKLSAPKALGAAELLTLYATANVPTHRLSTNRSTRR